MSARLLVVNAYSGGNRRLVELGRWISSRKPAAAILSEAQGLPGKMVGHLQAAGPSSHGQREVAVWTPTKPNQKASGQVSPGSGTGIDHDRWWSRVEIRVDGVPTRVYSLHLNAAIQRPDGMPRTRQRRWRVTAEGLKRLSRRWQADIDAGWAVVVGGDLNWNDRRPLAGRHVMSPRQVFRRLGMAHVSTELMWLAWTPEHHGLTDWRAVKAPGSDHPALDITMRARAHKPKPKEKTVATSANGWPALPGDDRRLHIWTIPTRHGDVRIKLRNGSVGFILSWVILRWAELFQPVAGGVLDDWGWAWRPIRGKSTGLSNHASGTAADVNATQWPLGTRNMSRWQRARVALVIGPARSVVTWGGVWKRPDQMHIEITAGTPMSRCEQVAKRLMQTPRGKRLLAANPTQKKVIWS